MTSSKDPEKHFPRLHIHILKTHAERWIKKFPEALIKRILLYSISFQLEGYMPDTIESYEPDPAIYAVVFEVDEENKTINMTPEELMEYDILCIRRQADLLYIEPDERLLLATQHPTESYERLLFATQPNLRISDFKNLPLKYLKLVTADFANVYKLPAKNNYLEEWRFIVKFRNAELNADIRTDKSEVVLWEQKQQSDSFLLKARQEVQIIYDHIKRNCGGLLTSPSELKHKKALEYFQRHKKNFKILTIEDLDATEIYTTSTKPNREIMGRILKKIVLRKNYISEGGQKLFYKTQKL